MSSLVEGVKRLNESPLHWARSGNALCLKVNSKSGTNAETVLTDDGFLYVIPEGEQIVITCFYLCLESVSDTVYCEFGYTENPDGSGAFTAISPKFFEGTGAANSGQSPSVTSCDPPMIVPQTVGAAFTARVLTNDAGATFTVACNGWHEPVQG